MRVTLIITVVLLVAQITHARTIEERVLVNYPNVLAKLKDKGFAGPFGQEIAKFATLRQIIEDGPGRKHSKSIVGMIPAGLNKEVVQELGLKVGSKNDEGFKLKRITAKDGQGTYAIYGQRANVLSAVAIAMVWDRYVNELECFKPDEVRAWNKSKVISRKMSKGSASPQAKVLYRNRLAKISRNSLERANRIYGKNAANAIKSLVKKYEPLFKLRSGANIN
jgi:hypothetical protein